MEEYINESRWIKFFQKQLYTASPVIMFEN